MILSLDVNILLCMIPNLHLLGSKYLRTILKTNSSLRIETATGSMKKKKRGPGRGFGYYKEGNAFLAMYREN